MEFFHQSPESSILISLWNDRLNEDPFNSTSKALGIFPFLFSCIDGEGDGLEAVVVGALCVVIGSA